MAKKQRRNLYCRIKIVSQDILQKGGFMDKMGHDIFFKDKKTAIPEIHKKIERPCKEKVFDECNV